MSGTVIVLKYSDEVTGTNQPDDDILARGEPAYTFKNGVLWIGKNVNGTIEPKAIGGEFYTDLLSATAGTLTASKALIVDSNKWIDELLAGGITLSTSGGTGTKFTGATTDLNSSALSSQIATASAIKSYIDSVAGATSLTVYDDANNSATIDLDSASLTFDTDGVLQTSIDVDSAGNVTITHSLPNTAVTAGDYGSSSSATIPTFTVDSQGRLTAAGSYTGQLTFAGDSGTSVVKDLGSTLTIAGTTNNIVTSANGSQISVDLATVTGVSGDWGSSGTKVPYFTVDSYGRITAINHVAIATALTVFADDAGGNNTDGSETLDLLTETLTVSGGTGLSSTLSASSGGDVTITINLDNTAVTSGSYGESPATIPTFTVDSQGRLTAAGSYTGKYTFGGDDATGDVNLGGTFKVAGTAPISTSYSNGTVTVSLDDTTTDMTGTAQYGSSSLTSTTYIPYFSVDRQGRLTAAGNTTFDPFAYKTFTVTNTDPGSWSDTGSTSASANADTLSLYAGTGIDIDVTTDALKIENTGVVTLSGSTYVSITNTDTAYTVTLQNIDVNNTANAIVVRDANGDIFVNNLTTGSIQLDDIDIYDNIVKVKSTSAFDNLILRGNTGGLVEIDDDLDVTGNVYITGDLTVVGTTTTINATNLSISDNMIYLNSDIDFTVSDASGDGTYVTYTTTEAHGLTAGMVVAISGMDPASLDADWVSIYDVPSSTTFRVESTSTDTFVSGSSGHARGQAEPDLGFAGGYYDGGYAHAGLFRDASDNTWKFYDGYTPEPDASPEIDTTHASFTLADVLAAKVTADSGFVGDLTGNADTATKLATGYTIALSGDVTATGVAFDGSGNITLSTTIAANSVALGTDTTGNYVQDVASSGSTITVTGSGSESASVNLEVNLTNTDFLTAVKGAVADVIEGGTLTNITISYDVVNEVASFTVNTATTSVLGVAKFAAYADAYRATMVEDNVTGVTANETPDRPAWSVTNGVPTLLRIEGGMF